MIILHARFKSWLLLELPPIEKFHSKLTKKNISQDDYDSAKSIFTKLKCENLGHYARIYCQMDTLLLLDCIQELRFDLYARSNLDIARYIGIPAFGIGNLFL